MDAFDMLSLNQRLEVSVEIGGKVEQYLSRIEERGEEGLVVAAPLWQGAPIRPPRGATVAVAAITRDALYDFTTIVRDYSDRPIATWTLEYPQSVHRIQRRQFVRFAETLAVRLTPQPPAVADPPTALEASTLNISGGGVLLAVSQHPPIATRLWTPSDVGTDWGLELRFPELVNLLRACGKVVRVEQGRGKLRVHVAMEFVEISETARQTIVRHIFHRQCELRHRGVL